MRKIERIFIHCTAGPQTQTILTILRYWKTVNKWKDPGYHYIIKPDGEIVQLLPEEKPSNGVAGYNRTSINVCYIGGVDKQGRPIDNRTELLKKALSSILKDLHKRYPNAEIMGHRDIWGTDRHKWKKMCPCFSVKDELDQLLAEEQIQEPAPPDIEEPIEEYNGPAIIQGNPVEPTIEESRPNPIDFIFKLIIKIVKYVTSTIRNRTSRNGSAGD